MRTILLRGLIACACAVSCFAGSKTWISFESEEISPGRWQNTYEVKNTDLTINDQPAAIKEFTIWFDFGLYANLVVTTTAPLSNAWDEIVWQSELVLGDDGGYDALAELTNQGIAAGQKVKGFSIAFDWLGAGTPGPQRYEIINPVTFETIDTGMTIPEPACAAIMLLGAIGMIAKRRR